MIGSKVRYIVLSIMTGDGWPRFLVFFNILEIKAEDFWVGLRFMVAPNIPISRQGTSGGFETHLAKPSR